MGFNPLEEIGKAANGAAQAAGEAAKAVADGAGAAAKAIPTQHARAAGICEKWTTRWMATNGIDQLAYELCCACRPICFDALEFHAR